MKHDNQNIILKTDQLSIGYTSKKKQNIIASNINISIKKGQLIGLIGANGIGKSTLIRTLSNVQNPLKGDIFINNKTMNKYNGLELAKVMSLVLTENVSSKNLSVFELVALGRQPYTNWVGSLSENDIEKVKEEYAKFQAANKGFGKMMVMDDSANLVKWPPRSQGSSIGLCRTSRPTKGSDIRPKPLKWSPGTIQRPSIPGSSGKDIRSVSPEKTSVLMLRMRTWESSWWMLLAMRLSRTRSLSMSRQR